MQCRSRQLLTSGHSLDSVSHRRFLDHDWRFYDDSPMENLLPSVVPVTNGSSMICRSPHVVRWHSASAASSFLLIPTL
ncbi:hypothetical protein HAX54_018201, partial [Datura stramonium]|nr:hypothetical protein [Datura stramonium]